MTNTETMLQQQIDANLADAIEFARQIESGEYGNQFEFTYGVTDETVKVIASTEDEAWDKFELGQWNKDNVSVERVEFDEPTIVDAYGNATPIGEWPLELVVKIGRPLAVVLAVGGPHVEITQEVGRGSARLAGYWGGDAIYKHHGALQAVLDYLTDGLYDEAPEEYK